MLADAAPARSARLSKGHLNTHIHAPYLTKYYLAAWHRFPARPALERPLISLRANGNLLNNFRLIWVIQPPAQKYSAFPHPQSVAFSAPSRLDKMGGSRVVTNAGRDAVDAAASGAKRVRRAVIRERARRAR